MKILIHLPKNTEVIVLIPKSKRKEELSSLQNNIDIECENSFSYVSSSGHIHSCPYSSKANINALTLTEINKVLQPVRNGYGLTSTIH